MTALSAIVIVLAMIAAGGGLLMDDLYRDNPFVTTLLVAVPILATARSIRCRWR